MDKDHITKEQFLIEFFGNFGRDIGNPVTHFTDNPNDIFSFIEDCTKNKFPAFISVNPRTEHDKVLGIEKIFFDFDYASKTFVKKFEERVKNQAKRDKVYEERKASTQKEVEIFLRYLEQRHINPLVIKTRRGFHIHIYLDKVYVIKNDNEELLEETYKQLILPFTKTKRHGYRFLDTGVLEVKRLCRIPTSIHQETGEECYLVKGIVGDKIIPDKLRGIDYYRDSGLKEDNWIDAVRRAIDQIARDKADRLKAEQERELRHKDEWESAHGFVGEIRPCFRKRIASGEMVHQMRLALEIEAYWAGYKTFDKMLELFKCFHDYDGDSAGRSQCRSQIEWFFKTKVPEIEKTGKWKPYRCTTIEDLNWCDKSQCPIYNRRKQKYGQKTT
jgi:hypothetical protein